ncbi:Hsp70 family protein [Endozoicomonas gorgoniicola]|uniref:Hsp70 family protein n=1 Tax=Endozoicomonas gorgoniicola TaxID=1234144 RepID=A0ABT3MX40_9GAMM|nr:Hsp70 family protein [Endozoicomonas gorgoniicola]MCW7553936.1 Hsp70 family protein [Endozoicomonas gorgoniicola]
MELQTAELILQNFLDRIETDVHSGQKKLPGIVTELEISSLELALAQIKSENTEFQDGRPDDTEDASIDSAFATEVVFDETFELPELDITLPSVHVETDLGEKRHESNITLNLKSLEYESPRNPETFLCIDFGTAMSKACMVTYDDGYEELLPLPLGAEAGESGYSFPITSSVYISLDGRLYFGQKAIEKSLEESEKTEHSRFDSLKTYIMKHPEGESLTDIAATPFEPSPTGLNVGALIAFYLAYVTDLIDQTIDSEHGMEPYTLRRFAIPCFEPERSQWVQREFSKLLSCAQVLADTFSEAWEDGITITDALAAWQQISKQPVLPEYLIDRSVTEPLASISSRLSPDKANQSSGLMMVVDIGAGTTDFSLYQMNVNSSDNRYLAIEVEDSNWGVNLAGDHIDLVLISHILEQADINSSSQDYKAIVHDLKLKARAYKEELFKENEVTAYLFNFDLGINVTLDEFLAHPEIQRFENELEKNFKIVLENVHSSWLIDCPQRNIGVAITGGGASMPMVKKLTQGQVEAHGVSVTRTSPKAIPAWLEEEYDDDIIGEYHQLAVSIGGSRRNVIEQMSSRQEYAGSMSKHSAVGLGIESGWT